MINPDDVSEDVRRLNPELFGKRPSRGPGKRALPIVQNGQPVDVLGNPNAYRYEHDLQVAIFQWAETAVTDIPELALMFAIPNGGHRNKATAGRLKAEGVRAGVPDIFLSVAHGGWHGLYIELKVGKNAPRDTQRDWLARLAVQGYKTAVCCDLDSTKALIIDYLNQ